MRRTLATIAVFAALGSVPVEARSIYAESDERMVEDSRRLADTLNDPDLQDGIADRMAAMTDAILGMPIGPFARAMEDAAPGSTDPAIRDDDTLADIAGPDGRYAAEDTRDQARRAARQMGRSARAMAGAMPALAEALGRLRGAMADAGADYEDDFDPRYEN